MSKSKQGRRNRARGNEFAVYVARLLNEAIPGIGARRGLQGQGERETGIPDVVCELPFHIECKTGKQVSIPDAIDQVCAAASETDYRLVVSRHRTRKDPDNPRKRMELATMPLGDFTNLLITWWMETRPRDVYAEIAPDAIRTLNYHDD